MQDLGDEMNIVWDRWSAKKSLHAKRNSLIELVSYWWIAWKARNDFVFKNTQPNPETAIRNLFQLVKEWNSLLSAGNT